MPPQRPPSSAGWWTGWAQLEPQDLVGLSWPTSFPFVWRKRARCGPFNWLWSRSRPWGRRNRRWSRRITSRL